MFDPVGTVDQAAGEAAETLTAYAASRDPEARAQLVAHYQGFAYALAGRFSTRQEAPDELRQAALIGLLHAIDRFEPDRGVKFTTFAWSTIMGELKRHFRDRTWGVRVPRRVQEAYLATAEATDDLTHQLGRAPTIAELSANTGLPNEDVIEALEARGAHRVTSIDAPVGEDGEATRQLGDVDDGYDHVERSEMLDRLLSRLPHREREIVRLRFVDELTQAEIADRVGVSQMHVSRLLTQSLDKLRNWAVAS